jgi:hypothetical protein
MTIDWIQEISKTYEIPIVQERSYWFVRTVGGDFFPDFIMNNYIAIGWDYISLDAIKSRKNRLIIRNKIEKHETKKFDNDTEKKKRVTSIYNKIKSFTSEMKPDDIVLIPSYNSDRLVIGRVVSDAYEDDKYIEKFKKINSDSSTIPCPYLKRRDVKWIKTYPKNRLDIYLQNAIRSQQALSSLNQYADIINRNIYEIYLSENKVHSVIKTEQCTDFSLADLKLQTDFIYDSYRAMGQYSDESFASDIKVKINLNSPLLMEIIIGGASLGAAAFMIAIFLAYNIAKNGGHLPKGKNRGGELTQNQLELANKLMKNQDFQDKREALDKLGVIMPDVNFDND